MTNRTLTVFRILGVMCAYWLFAQVSDLLKADPTYPPSVWPSTGIALGALLLWGPRMRIGIFLGAFASTSALLWNPSEPLSSLFVTTLITASIIFETSLAAHLLNIKLGPPYRLKSTDDLFRFVLYGGLLPFWITPTIAAISLHLTGTFALGEAVFNGLVWWGASTLGALASSAVMLQIFTGDNGSKRERGTLIALGLLVGVLFFALILRGVLIYRERALETEFEKKATELTAAIHHETNRYVEILDRIKAFWLSSNYVDEEEFHTFISNSLDRHPAIDAVGWLAMVTPENRAQWEKKHGVSIFEQEIGQPPSIAPHREFYTPIQYYSSSASTPPPKGKNVSASERGLTLFRKSVESGTVQTTPPTPLNRADTPIGFIIRIPVFEGKPSTPEERHASIQGFASLVVRAEPLITGSMEKYGWSQGLRIRDVTDPANAIPLYDNVNTVTSPTGTEESHAPHVSHTAYLEFGGHRWELQFHHSEEDRILSHTSLGIGALYFCFFIASLGLIMFILSLESAAEAMRIAGAQLAQKQAEIEDKLQTVLDSIVDGVVTIDENLNIRNANRAVHQLLGYTPEELRGRPFSTFMGMQDPTIINTHLRQSLSCATPMRIGPWSNIQFEDINLESLPVELTISPLHMDGERRSVVIIRDLSEMRMREKALLEKEAAESASELKNTFIATMSHELRTPLNAVIGYTELLDEEMEELSVTERKQMHTRIISSGKMLLDIINNILDLSKIESGKVETHVETTDLSNFIQHVSYIGQSLAEKNDNSFTIDLQTRGEITTDLGKLQQILVNLIGNAGKFTQNGTIRIQIVAKEEEGEQWILFRISDTGIGIEASKLDAIFRAFTQADSSTTRLYGGTGLGLTIARTFAELIGGSISVYSHPGCGSTFTVRIPRCISAREEVCSPE